MGSKPIIGIVGGIGSGKSFVADLFGELGCMVIKSDDVAKESYLDERVKRQLRQWWGETVFTPGNQVDRAAVARKIFTRPDERRRLEGLIHPIVTGTRDHLMTKAEADPAVVGVVWDTPLLIETDAHQLCSAVVFVDAPLALREQRVRESRRWEVGELGRRENSQVSLDNKRKIAQYIISNDADASMTRAQVRWVFSQIFQTVPTVPPMVGKRHEMT